MIWGPPPLSQCVVCFCSYANGDLTGKKKSLGRDDSIVYMYVYTYWAANPFLDSSAHPSFSQFHAQIGVDLYIIFSRLSRDAPRRCPTFYVIQVIRQMCVAWP